MSLAKAARQQFEEQFARDRALVDESARTWTNDPAERKPARVDFEP
jgi:hypothetical protein